ncbi:hypothetical protein OROGR_007124 [Orobanche gracilis]
MPLPWEFKEDDFVIVRIRPERFPKHSSKKLFARASGPFRIIKRLGDNAYLLDLPLSPIFNVGDLTPYRGTFEPPTFSASVTGGSATSPVSVPKLPPSPPLIMDEVDAILEDEIVCTSDGGFHRYLVAWKGRPASDNSWVQEEELRRHSPDLLEKYINANSPGSKLEELAVTVSFKIKKKDGLVKMQGSRGGRKRKLAIDAEIFEVAPSFHMVEVKKTAGDTLEYLKFRDQELKPSLKDVIWSWPGGEQDLQVQQPVQE